MTLLLRATASLALALAVASPAWADGSRELTNSGGVRPYLEARSIRDATSGIPRDNRIYVWVQPGETLLVASSAVGSGNGGIELMRPDGTVVRVRDRAACWNGTATGTARALRGRIANVAQEVAGPLGSVNSQAGGYNACEFAVDQGGIWRVHFTAPVDAGNGANPTARGARDAWTQDETKPHVVAWDVTVRNAASANVPGRVWARYLPINTGGYGYEVSGVRRPAGISSTLYAVTRDGYRWTVDHNGLVPFGAILMATRRGFIETATGRKGYTSVTLADVQAGTYTFKSPETFDGDAAESTHKLFFAPLAADLPATAPVFFDGQTQTDWVFNRTPKQGGQVASYRFVGADGVEGQVDPAKGGRFEFQTDGEGAYTIRIDRDGNPATGPNGFEVDLLRGQAREGANTVPWNGKDAGGTAVPPGLYEFEVGFVPRRGEIHFPYFDAEQNPDGIILSRTNGPGAPDRVVYWDDTQLGTRGGHTGTRSLDGTNSQSGAHRWGNVNAGDPGVDFGNEVGIDTWSFIDYAEVFDETAVRSAAVDLGVDVVRRTDPVGRGGEVVYDLVVTNYGPDAAPLARLTDAFPAALTGVTWTCAVTTDAGGPVQNRCDAAAGTAAASGTGDIAQDVALNPGAVLTFTVRATHDSSAGAVTNQATVVVRDAQDAVPANDTDADTFTPSSEADLRLAVAVDQAVPQIGDVVTFTLDLTNDGPAASSGSTVASVLAGDLDFEGFQSTSASYDAATGTLTFGALAVGATATATITAVVTGPALGTLSAQVASQNEPDGDSAPGNDAPAEDDQDAATVAPVQPDLELAVSASTAAPALGAEVTFTVTLANAGTGRATGVRVAAALPPGYALVSAVPSQGTWANGVWTLTDPVTAGGDATLALVARAETAALVAFAAQVTAQAEPDADSQPGNAATVAEDDDDEIAVDAFAPDLALAVSASTAAPTVGETLTLTVDLTSENAARSTGVAVAAALPTGYTLVDAVPSQGSYADGTWTVGTVEGGAAARLVLTARPTATGSTTFAAEVAVMDQPDEDSQPGDGSTDQDDDDALTLAAQAIDLELAVAVNNATPALGQTVTYTLTLDNAGGAGATGVAVRAPLPAGLTFVSTSGDYDPETGVWTVGAVAAGGQATVQITATVDATRPADLVAEVSAADQLDADSTPDNGDPDEDDRAVQALAVEYVDLALVVSASDAAPDAGQAVTLAVDLSNGGTVGATGVVARAALPAGYTFVSVTPSQGTYDADTGVWTVGAVAVGAAPRLEIVARAAAGDAVFRGEVTAADQRDADSVPNNGDPDEDDQNQVSLTGRPTDLALAVSASETAPGFGEAVTFTVVLDNQSAVDATGVAVAAALPAGYAFVSATPSQGAYADGTWTVGGVAGGASATLQVVATARTLDASTFSAQVAAASPADADSQPGNDDDTEDDQDAVAVQARPTDLALALAASDPAPGVGEETMLTLTLDNQSTVGATGVAVRLPVPSGYTVVSTAPSQGSYDPETGAWAVGAVAGSGQATLAVVLRAKALAPASITAEITAADQPDTDSQPGNGDDDEDDQATATLTPQPIDLALTASADDASPALGGTVTYTVTLDNESGAGATGVAVSAALPAGVTFVEATPSQGSYDAETGVWTVGAVAGNGRATLTLTATVASADLGDLVAQVSAADQPDADSAPGNGDDAEDDQARVALAVQAVDLALAVAASDPTPIPGRTITFMVTLANGRATGATGVAVRVPLPAGLAFVSTSGDYDPATGIWTVGAVDGDAAVTLDVVVRVDTASPATVTAEVVAADQPDVDSRPGNGDAAEDDQASATVTPQTVDLALAMTVDEPQPAAGDVVTFVITVANESTTGATGVQVSSRLIDQPGVAEVVSVTPSAGTFDGSLWLVGALAAGASETLAVAVRLLSDNVAFTHLAEIAAADQPDTDSTPYNGSTFEDDDASATATIGGSSSGGEGGLESDGSLAEAIGQVLFARRAETGALADAGVALEPVAFSASRSAGASLRRFLPTSGPRGATAVEVSPTDLLPVTNAREIVAADYLRADGRRAGVVFASATAPGEVYEHTKPVCDRLRGAALDAVDLVDVGGRPFVMTRLVQPDGAVDYAVSFVAYGPEEARTVDSRFLLGDYRVPAGGADVLNLQVWSPSPDYTRALVAEVLAALRAESDLTFRNAWTAARAADGDGRQSEGSRPDLPVVFVRAAEYDQGRVRLDLYNAGGARSLRLSGGTLARAEGGGRSDFVRTVEVAPGTPEAPVVPVVVETGFLFDVAFFVETDLSPEPDRLYLADGTWGVAVDRSSDATRLDNFAVRPQPQAALVEGQRLVERPVHATGTVATWATVYRTLRAGAQPLDLSGYRYVEFTAAGEGEVHLLLQKQSVVSADQYGAALTLTPEPRLHRVWFEDLALADGSRGFTGEDAVAISLTRRSDGTARPLDVAVSGLRFGGAAGDLAALPEEPSLWPAMPNPFSGSTRVRFELPEAQRVRVRVFDLLGREVARLADGEHEAGRHTVSFSGRGLSAGVYVVRLELADRAFTRQMTLVR